ncbi:ABC transporter permease subunit [Rhizobium sp. RHZ02]|uniref:ABC transporter permease subunit n=1 Tax=unclassified Rhizobium TaxID=2613769 RepID=UPI00146A0FD0|nr:ABC transporter permease subunit [Rhizobium sp. RHZ02]MBD9451300.1 ABC transporter permease [Rhizobium sp. RHZ02]NMN69645.1 Cu-processing system permease protein [Rhizobium sp. 57MFTsu3.2]
MNNIVIIARKEIQEGLRNRWVIAVTLLLASLALTLSFLGSAPTGNVGAGRLDIVIVSLASLTIFLVPLIALLLSHDAIVGELERGTLLLLLSYPVARSQIVFGKFLAHILILSFATLLGYGAAGLALVVAGTPTTADSWTAFGAMIGSSILLGSVFTSIGYLVSATVSQRSTAGGIALGVWLFFVIIYDMGLLGAIVSTKGVGFSPGLLSILLMANPTDAYRLLNLGSETAGSVSALSGLAASSKLSPTVLMASLALWVAVPLSLAMLRFSRREL